MSVKAMEWVSGISVGKASHKAVLIGLCNFHHQTKNLCDPSISTLVQFTELNKKTVLAGIKWLCEAGLIVAKKRFGASTKYLLVFDATGPKNGTASKVDTSSNFGTGIGVATGPKNGTGDTAPVVPNLELVPKTVPVPKTDTDRYQKRPEPVPNLEHKQENRIKQEKNNSLVEDSNSSPDEKLPGNPKNLPYLQAAHAMWEKIQPITRDKRPPNFESWAKDLRLLIETDGKEPQDVWRVFLWANSDSFWQTNILSPGKLRKQFGQLYAKSSTNPINKFERNVQVGMAWLESRNERSRNP